MQGFNQQIAGINGQLNSLNNEISKVERFAAQGVAAAMSMPSMPVLSPGHQALGFGTSEYGGQAALRIGYAY